jgi:hypothetical protein
MKNYRKTSLSFYDLKYHLVLITRYRKPFSSRLKTLGSAPEGTKSPMVPSKDPAAAFLEDWIARARPYGIPFLLVGDAYRLKDFGEEWTCTKTGYYKTKGEQHINSEWQKR